MKLTRTVSKVLSMFALGAVAAATPQLNGNALGHWTQVSPRSTTVDALTGQRGSNTRYHLTGLLVGYDRGEFYGSMEQLPQKGEVGSGGGSMVHLAYTLIGEYITLDEDALYVRAQILLDTTQFGGNQLLPVGTLDGQLLGTGENLGYCPGPIDPLAPNLDPDLHSVDPSEPGGGPVAIDEQPVALPAPTEPTQRSGRFVAQWSFF